MKRVPLQLSKGKTTGFLHAVETARIGAIAGDAFLMKIFRLGMESNEV